MRLNLTSWQWLLLPWLLVVSQAGAESLAKEVQSATLPGSEQLIETQWRQRWAAAGETESAYLNRLALSDSAYLFQHGDNPIDWYPWSDESMAKAKAANQLIFLSIGYASCHWCHVMEKESFSDPAVAALLNQDFVALKVDREQHPDVDQYYSRAVEMMQGEAGWPLTLVLTPEGKTFLAASYLSNEALRSSLIRSQELWQSNPGWVRQNAQLISDQVEQLFSLTAKADQGFNKDWLQQAAEALVAEIDPEQGGFGMSAKFPSELKLQYLLDRYKVNPSEGLRQTLTAQLDRFYSSGLVDIVFGGVFRYTTDREMSTPHYEKMLYNQALTVALFADAAVWLQQPKYQDFAGHIIDYVNRVMKLDSGAIAAAVDADHKGVEGGYYFWSREQLATMSHGDQPGDQQGIEQLVAGEDQIFIYGSAETAAAEQLLNKLKLLRSDSPRVIANQVTAWNALWLSALVQAGEPSQAASLADILWQSAWRKGVLYRLADQPGYLDDYAYLARAYWQLFLLNGDRQWRSKARMLAIAMLDRFYQDGSLYYQESGSGTPLRLENYHDQVLPNAAVAALTVFDYHQTELEFITAASKIRARAYAAVTSRPQAFTSLLNLAADDSPAARRVIANGHGKVALLPGSTETQWNLAFEFEPGWHINASKVLDKSLIPTSLSSDQSEIQPDYPQGILLETEFSDQPLLLYEGSFSIPIKVEPDSSRLTLKLRYQACSNTVCLLPETSQLTAHQSD